MKIRPYKAVLQELAKTELLPDTGYNVQKALEDANTIKQKVCTQGYDVVAKQTKLLSKYHGINGIMYNKKDLTKLVACGLVINGCDLYGQDGHWYNVALHCTVNHSKGFGNGMRIVGVHDYLKYTDHLSDTNDFFARFGLPQNIVDIHRYDGDVKAVTGSRTDIGKKGYNLSIFTSGNYDFARPRKYRLKQGKSTLGGNTKSGRFRFNISKGPGGKSIFIERAIMLLTLAYTGEFPVYINNNMNAPEKYTDALSNIQANVTTGNAAYNTALDIANGWNGVRFECVEPVLKEDNSTHAQSIRTVSEIVNKHLKLKYGEKAVVSFSANDKVIEEGCKQYRANKGESLEYLLFRYIVSVCNIYIVS